MVPQSQSNVKFTEVELTEIQDIINQLEAKLKNKVVQLTAKENLKFGKVGPETEKWVSKIYKDCHNYPVLIPPFLNVEEWETQKKVMDCFIPSIQKLETIIKEITETNRLVGYDFYQNSMTLYRNCRYLSEENVPGTKLIFDDWSTFFEKTLNKPSENSTK
jgi:hypothetical protein